MNINDYLTEEQKHEIACKTFKDMCAVKFSKDFERILSNAAYETAAKIVESSIGESMDDIIADKAKVIIEELTAFTVFKKPDVWDRDSSRAYKVLQDCVSEEKEAIKEKVNQAIKTISKKDALEIIKSKEFKLT